MRDLDENVPDPRNPRKEAGQGGDVSWFAMPGWQEPSFLTPAPAERKGRVETHTIDSAKLSGKRTLDVYVPAGYDASTERLPVVYVPGGKDAIEQGGLPNVLDQLIGAQAPSMVVVFVHPQPPPPPGTRPADDQGQKLSESLAEEVVPFVDGRYRTRTERGARALVAGGFAGYEALDAAFRRPDVFGRVSTQSAFMLTEGLNELKALLEKATTAPESVSLEWSAYDLRAEHEGWNNAESNRALAEFLKGRGVPVTTREVSEGFAWGSWRNRADLVFGRLFGRLSARLRQLSGTLRHARAFRHRGQPPEVTMSQLLHDLRFAMRSLAKTPGTSLLMVGTLAIGLAANGIIFNFLDALILRAFDFPNAGAPRPRVGDGPPPRRDRPGDGRARQPSRLAGAGSRRPGRDDRDGRGGRRTSGPTAGAERVEALSSRPASSRPWG